ncbi:MAG: hypothetical protein AAGL08_13890 [Cyanobacteria bacterium J06573_11]
MSTQFDVQGPDKWELTYVDTKVAPDGRNRYIRRRGPLIEPFDVPIVFDSHVLAISATYLAAPETWYNCANIIQLATGATIDDPGIWADGYTGTEPIIIDRKRLRLNQSLELFQFQPVSSELRIGIQPLPWIPQFSFGIYQFRGTVEDTTENLVNAARAQLTTVEAKVDYLQLLSQGGDIDGGTGNGNSVDLEGNT